MAQFSIGQQMFRSKAEARATIQGILAGAPGARLTGSVAQLITDLIADGRHPEFEEKVGAAIDYIEVRSATYGSSCFWIIRVDGSEVDFSYKRALDGRLSLKAEVCAALRCEVRTQVQEFHEKQPGAVTCSICGDVVSSAAAHVTYAKRPSFDEIATGFACANGSWPALSVIADGPHESKLADRVKAAEWLIRHNAEASLSLAHSQCILRRSRA